jgi:hypothetical protein
VLSTLQQDEINHSDFLLFVLPLTCRPGMQRARQLKQKLRCNTRSIKLAKQKAHPAAVLPDFASVLICAPQCGHWQLNGVAVVISRSAVGVFVGSDEDCGSTVVVINTMDTLIDSKVYDVAGVNKTMGFISSRADTGLVGKTDIVEVVDDAEIDQLNNKSKLFFSNYVSHQMLNQKMSSFMTKSESKIS